MVTITGGYLACKGEAVVDIFQRGADDEGVAAIVNKDGIDLIYYGEVQRTPENLRLTWYPLVSNTEVVDFFNLQAWFKNEIEH